MVGIFRTVRLSHVAMHTNAICLIVSLTGGYVMVMWTAYIMRMLEAKFVTSNGKGPGFNTLPGRLVNLSGVGLVIY